MQCEVVAVGTELLLGQIVDTNSSYIGEQLTLIGIDSHHQTKVGDNLERMVAVLRQALDRSDAVIVCGGLGPTQDDITRHAIAEVMGVELVRDEAIVERIQAMFGGRGREMPDNNLRQADVPEGALINPVMPGTAPGLICPLTWPAGSGRSAEGGENRVIYAVPGVPWEMQQMVQEGILPDLSERAGITAVIRSRTLRTWGHSESGLAELLDDEISRLDDTGEATLAFLASGWEGLKIRITAKAPTEDEAKVILDDEDERVRAIIGDIVFGVDDDTMESVVLEELRRRGMTLGLAESITGGLIASRITGIPGCSDVFLGAVVPYDRAVKISVLGTSDIAAVSEEMAKELAEGVCRTLRTDVGLATTGVAGPEPHEGQDPGNVWIGLHLRGESEAMHMMLPFDRDRVRQFTCITALSLLRQRLTATD